MNAYIIPTLRGIRIFAVLVALSVVLEVVLSFGKAEARIHDIPVSSEKFHAKNYVEALYTDDKIESVSTDEDVLRIQKEIVDANPNVLWFEDGEHDFFIRPVMVVNYKNKTQKAQNLLDGYITISNGMIDLCNGKNCNKSENIYNNSKIAFILAHEMGHWHNVEPASKTPAQSRDYENKADSVALKFVGNTPFHGYGGALMNFSKKAVKAVKTKENASHDSDAVRFKLVKEATEKASKNRVKVNAKGNCTVDGKGICAPAIGDEVSSVDRTLYVAGQIASAIENGLWKKENVRIVEQDSIFHNGSKNLAMIVVDGDSFKLIDKFNVTAEHLDKVKNALWIEQFFGFNKSTDEDRYFLNLTSMVKN